MSDSIATVTDSTFSDVVIGSDKPFLLDFWAPWCGPCRMMEPVLEEFVTEHGDKIAVGKLNVDENPQTATEFDVLSIPTMLLFVDGELAKKLVGAMPKKRLLEELSAWAG